MPQQAQRNPQTVAFLNMLGLPYNLDHGGSSNIVSNDPLAGKPICRCCVGRREPPSVLYCAGAEESHLHIPALRTIEH